ncbi:MAG: hypothetical protein ABI779_19055 [Acidobacteriota bacterium]
MKRETVTAVLQRLRAIRANVDETRKIIDEEGLQVGDRNIIDHALATVISEVDVLSRTLGDMLADPSKIE